MKENYIEEVKHSLVVSKKQKDEVVRDLQEAFASALEHGETEQQVIERLGSPADFVDSIHEQFGINCIGKQNRKKKYQIGVVLAIAIATFSLGVFIKTSRIPANVIGQADAITNIQINGAAFDPFVLFIVISIVLFILAISLIIRYTHKK